MGGILGISSIFRILGLLIVLYIDTHEWGSIH